jgi:hypothetical protein
MTFQDHRTDPIEGSLGCLYLADHIDAICVVLHHTLDATQMTLNVLQAMNDRLFLHQTSLSNLNPPPGGQGIPIIHYSHRVVKNTDELLFKV